MNSFSKFKQSVIFVSPTDEMRHPYESLLEKISVHTEWVSSFKELTTLTDVQPLAVIIDIDPLSRPLEPHLESVRFQFPKSELIALSSTDSATTALLVIRSGFADFLLKPISPEELLWSIKKSIQRLEVFQKFEEPETHLVRALSQISSCSTPSLVRLTTLEFLKGYFDSKGAAWISLKPTPSILCSFPKGFDEKAILSSLSSKTFQVSAPPAMTWSSQLLRNQVFLSCFEGNQALYLWSIDKAVTEDQLLMAKTLLEHAELSLLNLEKFEEIKHLSFVDELTGLYNSRYLKYALTNSINRSKSKNRTFGVLFIDVDHFKSINNNHGHIVGSDFLIAIGKSVRNSVRENDLVFRYGGDEFIVILSDTEIEGAKVIAERIRSGIEKRLFSIQQLKLQTTVSIGIAMFPEHAQTQEALLQLADTAMYSAKERSRNVVEIYRPEEMKKPQKVAS